MSRSRALSGVAALLLVMAAAACDGGSGDGSETSVDDFCAAYFSLFSGGMSTIDPQAPAQQQTVAMTEALRVWAGKLKDVGTPDEMPDEAREGYDLIVSAAADLPPGAAHNLADLGDDFTEHEMGATEAFEEYATQNCESPFGDPPTP
jgi:hypothetical protein